MEDFRKHSIEITRRELGIVSDDALLAGDRSGVVELPQAMRFSVGATRLAIRGWWASAGALFVASAALLATLGEPASPLRLCVAAGCLIASQGCLVIGGFRELVLARRIARTRVVPPAFAVDRVIGIEPTDTFRTPKAMCDDVGSLAHDQAGRRVLIDGAAHRYLICGRDVELVEPASAGIFAGASVRVRIGGDVLAITLSQRMLFSRVGGVGASTTSMPLPLALAQTLGLALGTVYPPDAERLR